MNIKYFLLLILFFTSNFAHAMPKAYFKQHRTFLQPTIVVVDGVEYGPQLLSHKIKIADAMKQNPEAYESALSHEQYMTRSSWFIWGGLGLSLLYSVATDPTNQGIYWSIFGTGFISGLYYQNKGNQQLTKAVNLYSKEF